MEATKKTARANGYVTTLFGRKCHYPRINASNPSERAFNERAAINAPLQGSAADIIRRAMVRMDDALAKAGLSAQMLLTVHDELVFEAPDDEVEATLPVVAKVMVEAPEPAVQLHAPLKSTRTRRRTGRRRIRVSGRPRSIVRHCEPQGVEGRPSSGTGFGEAIQGPQPVL